jgi:hypothetical protein
VVDVSHLWVTDAPVVRRREPPVVQQLHDAFGEPNGCGLLGRRHYSTFQ